MENVIYNELLISGYKVDVGSVDCTEYIERKQEIERASCRERV